LYHRGHQGAAGIRGCLGKASAVIVLVVSDRVAIQGPASRDAGNSFGALREDAMKDCIITFLNINGADVLVNLADLSRFKRGSRARPERG